MVLQQKSKACIWGKAGVNEQISISTSWGAKKTLRADIHGLWSVKIPTPKGSYEKETISIVGENKINLKDILVGEVWLCSGQSNMEFNVGIADNAQEEIKNANYPNIRFFRIPKILAWEPNDVADAQWQPCTPETVGSESAVAYFFGRKLHNELNVPIGLIVAAWGGSDILAWIDKNNMIKGGHQEIVDWYNQHEDSIRAQKAEYLKRFAAWKSLPKEDNKPNMKSKPKSKLADQHIPFVLYNGMIHPIKTYTIQGAIWYQGENNVPRANQYRSLFPLLINSWRTIWGQGDFPFYFVQIAPFRYDNPDGVSSAELRDAQLKTLGTVKNTGMVVPTDISKEDNIHPKNKQEAGRRLALLALHNDYKTNHANFSSAFYKSHCIKGNKVTIKFDFAEQLKTKGNKVIGFMIAAKDEKFVSAEAKIIHNNQVEVWSDQISQPEAVRFGWANSLKTDLFNEIDLPVSPFKTDDWKDTTKGVGYQENFK
jgi:sialate O-acetylesterase